MKILTAAPTGSPEWLAARKGRIGCSLISSCLGFDPREGHSALDAYIEIQGLGHEREQTPEMEAGSHFERAIAELWAKRAGAKLLPSPGLIEHPALPFIVGTPDFLAELATGERVVPEIKRRSWFSREDWEVQPPLPEWTQGNFYTRLAEVDRVVFVVDFGQGELYEHFAVQDEIFLMRHEEAIGDWYEKHVVARVPPNPRGEDVGTFAKLYPKDDGSVVWLDDGDRPMIDRLAEVRKAKSTADKEEKAIKAYFASKLVSATAALCKDGYGVIWRHEPAEHKAKDAYTQDKRVMRITRKGFRP